MRVSEHYELGRTQAELDFVDVDVVGDTRLFIDPQTIRRMPGDWAHGAVAYTQDFFTVVLDAINKGRDADARRLLRGLREPNETHLGLSRGRSRGRALGPESAHDVWQALSESQAARSGLLIHLEDTASGFAMRTYPVLRALTYAAGGWSATERARSWSSNLRNYIIADMAGQNVSQMASRANVRAAHAAGAEVRAWPGRRLPAIRSAGGSRLDTGTDASFVGT